MAAQIVILDYGMGNLWSVQSALRFLGAEAIVSADPRAVRDAHALILPGVGSFFSAMQALQSQGLAEALHEAVCIRKRKILGICLGMQLMAQQGTEDGDCPGLGFLPGTVRRFRREALGELKTPHIGFSQVDVVGQGRLFKGLSPSADFYFVHSYRLPVGKKAGCAGICRHGGDFLAAYELENVFATQFHPEKSQTNGLHLLANFLAA